MNPVIVKHQIREALEECEDGILADESVEEYAGHINDGITELLGECPADESWDDAIEKLRQAAR